MATPTRYKNGVSTAAPNTTLADFVLPDPTSAHVFFTDFDEYAAGDWVITTTEAGAGSATEALSDADGGVLVITNDDADDDNDFLQWAGGSGGAIESFLLESGKKTWFKARFKVSDATDSDFVIGLQITDTSPLAVSDGVFFSKADGSTSMTLEVEKDGAATSTTAATIADDTYVVAGFFYDGASAIKVYVDDVLVGESVTTNIPDDEELGISFGIQNGAAAAKVMSVDYIFAAKAR